jgi:signal transduction histidine kinase
VPAANGDPARMVGVNYDVTDRVEPLQRLEKIARNVPGVIYQFRLDADGQVSFPYASEGIREIYGVTPEAVRDDAGPAFAVLHPDDLARVRASIARSAEILGLWSCDYRVIHPVRGLIWVYGQSVPERRPDGAILWHGYILDVTERKALEEDLRRSNTELEEFAYAASHDLRQPLRMINSFTGLLEKTLADTLDDDAREMMAFVRDGTRQMDEMLVSLLEYSRVGRLREQPEPHDIRALLDAVLSHLVVELEDSGATVDIRGDWPMLSVSGAEALRLFENLIGNALKYRAPDRAPIITVAVEPDGAMWRFSVADNGIGIDPSQTERVFKVFERLHTREAYEGAGIGLAICRKIVEQHGGAIWIESPGAGQGTTVLFTLPRATEEPAPTA